MSSRSLLRCLDGLPLNQRQQTPYSTSEATDEQAGAERGDALTPPIPYPEGVEEEEENAAAESSAKRVCEQQAQEPPYTGNRLVDELEEFTTMLPRIGGRPKSLYSLAPAPQQRVSRQRGQLQEASKVLRSRTCAPGTKASASC